MIRKHFCALMLFLSFIWTNTLAADLPNWSPFSSHQKTFLSVTDIHFTPFSVCSENNPCPLIDILRLEDAKGWEKTLSEYDTTLPQYGEDTNIVLLKSTIKALEKVERDQKPQFVVLLGDFLGHDYKILFMQYSTDKSEAAYRNFVLKTFEFLSMEINQNLFPIKIYSVLGNNDSYGNDYSSDPNGAFYHDIAKLWSNSIKNKNKQKFLSQFSVGGYYSIELKHELRIIALNTVLFSAKASGVNIQKAADEELNWLHDELAAAHQKHQKVLLLMHIPVGVDVYSSLKTFPNLVSYWQKLFSEKFLKEIQNYSADVMGILAGHTHCDWFQALDFNNVIPVSYTPAISPQFKNNPAFKTYFYDSYKLQLTDYETYYRDLSKQSKWLEEYNFHIIYEPTTLHGLLIDGINNLTPTSFLSENYKTFFAVNTNTQPITTTNKWLPFYWCAIHHITEADYTNCVNQLNHD